MFLPAWKQALPSHLLLNHRPHSPSHLVGKGEGYCGESSEADGEDRSEVTYFRDNEVVVTIDDLADPENAVFVARLIPTIDPARITGARTPALRARAKDLWRNHREDAVNFLDHLPHDFLEEDLLHGLLIALETDPEVVWRRVEEFLPHIDNWAACDIFSPKALATDLCRLEKAIRRWAEADQPLYTRRFAVCMLMEHFLSDNFRPEFHELVAGIESEEHYLQMVQGWWFATAMAKQPDATLPWLVEDRLSLPVRRKAIQKTIESLRVPPEVKDLLRQVRSSLPRKR